MRGTAVGFPANEDFLAEWCDTILNSGVEFMADMQDADSYEWYIGTETEPRFGRSFKLSFSDYFQDTLQNINPDNPDYYLPLDIVLTVINEAGGCVDDNDTMLTSTSQLVFTRKSLVAGNFVGRVEGESFDREISLWLPGFDPDATGWETRYFSQLIGLPNQDTLRYYGALTNSIDGVRSYKQRRWATDLNGWWLGTDGIRVWEQEVITRAGQPDLLELYFERIPPEDESSVEIVRFSGERTN
jgi:hypothetical protein